MCNSVGDILVVCVGFVVDFNVGDTVGFSEYILPIIQWIISKFPNDLQKNKVF